MSEQGERPTADGLVIDFTTFVLSLSTSAFVQLGVAPDGKPTNERNLPMAKQTIDVIAHARRKDEEGTSPGEEEAPSH